MRRRDALPLVSAALLLLPSSSCHDPDGEVVVVVQPNPAVQEHEPNDDASQAQFLGTLRPGDRVLIQGEISSTTFDPFDGFAFISGQPLLVEFFLEAHDGADLDLCIFEPAIDDFSLCYENSGPIEQDAFEVVFGDSEFHFVVAPFDFASRYTLEILAHALPEPLPLAEEGPGPPRTAGGLAARSSRAAPEPRRPETAAYGGPDRGERGEDPLRTGRLWRWDPATGELEERPVVETGSGLFVGPPEGRLPGS